MFRPRWTDSATDFVADFLSCVSPKEKTDFVTDLRLGERGQCERLLTLNLPHMFAVSSH